MAILNCTPHDIVIYSQADCTWDKTSRKQILRDGATPLTTLQKSGVVLSAKMASQDDAMIDGIPIIRQTFVDIDPLPLGADSDYCVVSQLYMAAVKQLGLDTTRLLTGLDTTRLLTVGVPIYKGVTPQPCGVLNLQRG